MKLNFSSFFLIYESQQIFKISTTNIIVQQTNIQLPHGNELDQSTKNTCEQLKISLKKLNVSVVQGTNIQLPHGNKLDQRTKNQLVVGKYAAIKIQNLCSNEAKY